MHNSTAPFPLGGKLINPIGAGITTSDSKNSVILALNVRNGHKLIPLCSKTKQELSFVKTTKLINQLELMTWIILEYLLQCSVSWTEGYVVRMSKEVRVELSFVPLGKEGFATMGSC